MSVLQRLIGTLLLVVTVIALAVAVAIIIGEPDADTGDATGDAASGRPYPGDPTAESQLVAAERDRLAMVTALAASVPWRVDGLDGPYQVPTTPLPTLVLPARPEPYTVAELQDLSPGGFAQQADGSWLLSENIVATRDAILDLSGATDLRMLSTPGGFTSIVVVGGTLRVSGAPGAPVTISSVDPNSGARDTTTADGRAYVRVNGGSVDVSGAVFTDLGFWGGETGGLSFTGGSGENTSPTLSDQSANASGDGAAPMLTPDDVAAALDGKNQASTPVTGTVRDTTITGGAYGLFLSDATGFHIENTRIEGALVAGLVLHRAVTDAQIVSTTVLDSAADGIVVDRSSTSISLTDVTVSGSGRNGITVDGRPLAGGPNAAGAPTSGYGDVQITGSRIADNDRYGIEISGGSGVTVTDTDVAAGIVGVVVDDAAASVSIDGNTIAGQSRQAIALRDGATQVGVTHNRIASVNTGVHVADGDAQIQDNRFLAIGSHAVTLVGHAGGSRVLDNTIAGHGTDPIHDDAIGGYAARNDVEQWATPVTPRSVLEFLAQPLTLIWAALGALVVITALVRRRAREPHNPYPEHVPLTELTRGIIPAESLRRSEK